MNQIVLTQPCAVIFDMDGLLLDTEVLYREVMAEACSELGHEMAVEIHSRLIGVPKDRGAQILLGHFGSDFPLAVFHERTAAAFAARCANAVPVKKGAHELLQELRTRGIPTAVATSTHREAALDHLHKAGLLDLFETVVTRDDVEHGKPHPESFLTAAQRLDVDPRTCWALEDSHNGVRAAHAAGMATIMIPDLLEPTAEISKLCATVLPSLLHMVGELTRVTGR
ncbi:HAD family hydrolase [Microvirga lotononidis]|uniref:Haloacid dehalogenase superfamily protein, subfamily IA, variant 3 with third motif having DD or ED n=1 Tax=Microvirga lotononidis TaxID=864069 RepID=I4YQY7_9HYPH|nr:HAD family phosphatase [Microvirga lotononidis]EIM26379.1 haloacid dehalogenase superfamily protein, subfamily IA, variant 3 with third motif having DD or ED [Microvirga lotononidis]WQO30744.1 HAD family phosphatase [Microvirga lotononidis]